MFRYISNENKHCSNEKSVFERFREKKCVREKITTVREISRDIKQSSREKCFRTISKEITLREILEEKRFVECFLDLRL